MEEEKKQIPEEKKKQKKKGEWFKVLFTPFMLKYLFSSMSCTAIDLVLFEVFVLLGARWFGQEYRLYYPAAATVLARIISATYNYLFNYFVVFRSTENKAKAALRFFVLSVAQMLASAGLVTFGCFLLPFLPDVIVKLVVDTALFFAAYIVQKKLIF